MTWTALRPFAPYLAGLLALIAAYACGDHNGAKRERLKAEAERAAVLQRNTTAHQKAAEQRASDEALTRKDQEARDDAIKAGPDEAPSGPELRLACERLRKQQGTRVPAACGSSRP